MIRKSEGAETGFFTVKVGAQKQLKTFRGVLDIDKPLCCCRGCLLCAAGCKAITGKGPTISDNFQVSASRQRADKVFFRRGLPPLFRSRRGRRWIVPAVLAPNKANQIRIITSCFRPARRTGTAPALIHRLRVYSDIPIPSSLARATASRIVKMSANKSPHFCKRVDRGTPRPAAKLTAVFSAQGFPALTAETVTRVTPARSASWTTPIRCSAIATISLILSICMISSFRKLFGKIKNLRHDPKNGTWCRHIKKMR